MLVFLSVFFVLVALSTPISIALGITSVVMLLTQTDLKLMVVAQRMFTGIDSFPLMAIPFFILSGHLMNAGGTTQRLITFCNALVGRLRGGLANISIVGYMIMAGISGSSVADASALGSIIIPAMKKGGGSPLAGGLTVSRRTAFCSLFVMYLASAGAAWAVMAPHEATRFDGLVIYEPAARLGVVAEARDAIPDFAEGRAGWAAFREAAGGTWDVHVDRRSGVPLLVQGSGIRLYDPEGPLPTVAQLEGWASDLVARHGATFRFRGSELQLDADATAMIDKDRGVIVFARAVASLEASSSMRLISVPHVAMSCSRFSRFTAAKARALYSAFSKPLP